MLRVQGLADSRPFDEQDPRAPANRRISIIVMNREAEDRFYGRDPWAAQAGSAEAAEAAEAESVVPSIKPELVPGTRASSSESHGR